MSFAAIYKKLVEGINFKSLSFRNANDAVAIENVVQGPIDIALNNKTATATSNEINTAGYTAIALEINTWSSANIVVSVLNYPMTQQGTPDPGKVCRINTDGALQPLDVTVAADGTFVAFFPLAFDFTKISVSRTAGAYTIKYRLLTHTLL